MRNLPEGKVARLEMVNNQGCFRMARTLVESSYLYGSDGKRLGDAPHTGISLQEGSPR